MHRHCVDRNEAKGEALTRMVENDDDTDHYLKYIYVGRMMHHGQAQ